MRRTVALVLLALAPSTIALADEATARKNFDDGERAYNLGEFDRAAELFRKAYEEWPEPAFLFNLAQTYRQAGDCKQASFFYKRFLALKEQDTRKPIKPELKAEVEKRIGDLDECVKREIANKPPNELDQGGTGGTTSTGGTGSAGGTGTGGAGGKQTALGGGEGEGEGDEGEGDEGEGDDGEGTASDKPTLLSLRVAFGAAKLGAGDLDTKLQFATSLVGGYPLSLGDKLRLDLGAALAFTPVPYTTAPTSGMSESGTAAVIGIGANVAPVIEIVPKVSLRADVGIGVQLFSGLGKEFNPFTENGGAASGALSSLLVRAAVSGEYAVTPNVAVMVTPFAFTYSPAPSGFDPAISSVTTIGFFAGVGYQR